MALAKEIKETYEQILKKELRPAMGCTEPISIAYASALAREVLGCEPKQYIARCSGNIIKNVKAVTIPQTNGLKGIEAAVLAGGIGGDASRELEVLMSVTDRDREQIRKKLEEGCVQLELLDSNHPLHLVIECWHEDQWASVEIIDGHTNLGEVYKNGIRQHDRILAIVAEEPDYQMLNVKDILTFAEEKNLSDTFELMQKQIICNQAISEEGLRHEWGACVGRTLIEQDSSTRAKICAAAAAGSDARMNGCALPVIINSGSGNQGLTVSVPVAEYAKLKGFSHEKLLRALCVSNLIALRQKRDVGKLSAFCGAVSAAAGAAAGIAYLDDAPYEVICDTITNTICTIGGMVCDGAKSSCASKIGMAIQCGLLGYEMARKNRKFFCGEGIVGKDIESTISSVGRVARPGMCTTDKEILHMMIGK